MEGVENPVYSRNVVEFVTVANEYCKFIESSSESGIKEIITTVHHILPLLYLKGTLLPKLENTFEEFNEKFVTEDEYEFIRNDMLLKFGEHDIYEEIYDPLRQENDEPVQLSVSESIADIYQDMKDFVMQYRTGATEIMTNAVWECQDAFGLYWGQRIVNVQRVLHNLLYSGVNLPDDNPEGLSNVNTKTIEPDTSNWFITKMQEGFKNEE